MKNNLLLKDSKLLEFLPNYNYIDSYSKEYNGDENIEQIYLRLVNNSSFITKALMNLRNKIVKVFGLKAVVTNNTNKLVVGEKTGLFYIYNISDIEVIAGEKDSHLDFCTSLSIDKNRVVLSTVVKYNNTLGKIYFNIIKPFHKIVAKNSLDKL